MEKKQSHEVFGISNEILADSYIDRGNLDEELQRLLNRRLHIALRGESKCGKSWLRQQTMPDAIVVQCRFGKTVRDIYTDALSQIGITFIYEEVESRSLRGRVECDANVGHSFLAKLGFKVSVDGNHENSSNSKVVGKDINDLKHIADILIASGKRLVIEDFHYLCVKERQRFAFELKALWDYGCFVTIIGVWSQNNLLCYLNPDLTGRLEERSIFWSHKDLKAVIEKGSSSLKIRLSEQIQNQLVNDAFGNVGILQKLLLGLLDESSIYEEQAILTTVSDQNAYDSAAMSYAEQLNAFYQQFAKQVSLGIRVRKDSTGIYAHAMAVIMDATNDQLLAGIGANYIFAIAHNREPRIQLGNLKTILKKLEELQIDEDGRGLVIAYDDSNDEITIVDRQLLFYRKYLTVKWPWEELVQEVQELELTR